MLQLRKKLLSRLFKDRSRRRTRPNRSRVLRSEQLELRSLMAADIGLINGVLTISADPAGTNASVIDQHPANPLASVQVITTSPNGNLNLVFNKASFVSIRFNGSDQPDTFSNITNIRSVVYSYGGADTLQGGSNVDNISGQNGDDVIRGGGGNDLLFGGNDDDVIEGQAGDDLIYGQNGNDHLFGGAGDDSLYGGAGRDGLFGDSGLDVYDGGSGADRYLNDTSEGHQLFASFSTADVQINFSPAPAKSFVINGTNTNWGAGSWSTQDILKVDKSLEVLARRTGNNVLLVDVDGSELNFYRHSTYSDDNLSVVYTAYNNGSGMYFSNSVFANEDKVFRTVVHEIGHNWDSAGEVNMRLPGQGNSIINGFRNISSWKSGSNFAENVPGYSLSKDGEWSYATNATFARSYGKTNPAEDFSTALEAYFLDYDNRPNPDGNINSIPWKWLSQNMLLNRLADINFVNPNANSPSGDGQLQGGGQLAANSKSFRSDEVDGLEDFELPKPTISEDEGKVSVEGTGLADRVSVNYVVAIGGAVSVVPTPWIRVHASNPNGSVLAYFATASISLVSFNGYPGNDFFTNQTAVPSYANGGLGNDILRGGTGSDKFIGGLGNDELRGGGGNDILNGDAGVDWIWGDAGEDYIDGGDDSDQLFGGLGDDHLIGRLGNDILFGDSGRDILEGNEGNDTLWGGDGRDLLFGGRGFDTLHGGNGDDLLVGDEPVYDNINTAVIDIWSEWNSAHTYEVRIRNIARIGNPGYESRLNKDTFIQRGITLANDAAADTLLGEGGRDVFFSEFGFDGTDAAFNEAIFS